MRSPTRSFRYLTGLALLIWIATAQAQSPGLYCGGAVAQTLPRDLDNVVGELTIEYQATQLEDHRLRCGYGYAAEKCGDHVTALKIYERCIAQGHAGAMIRMAMMYESGSGVATDFVRAAALFRRAAKAGIGGYGTLGKLHYASALWLGQGVARDEAEALRWFRAAAAEGDRDARMFLSTGYHTAWRDASGQGVGRPLREEKPR